jgi:hypothetical protein
VDLKQTMHTKIELQPRREQHLARWKDLGADLELAADEAI